jgi:regulator of ribonuclease activity A
VDFQTADLCDRFAAELQIGEALFRDYGGQPRFAGQIATIKCFEDNSRVRDLVAEAGRGRVLVIDAGGSMRRAVLGDMLAKQAVDNGWSGIVVYGCIRDSFAIAQLALGVKALGTCPLRTDKRGEGQRDEDGLVVAQRPLL